APPRPPAAYGSSSAFTITPSWPRARASARNAAASAPVSAIVRGTRICSGTAAASRSNRSVAGRSSTSAPSACRTSKKSAVSGTEVAAQHGGPADVCDRHRRRLRDRLGHDPGQRPLAQVAEDQRHKELLLLRRRAPEQTLELLASGAARARPGGRGQALERRID